MHCVNHDTGVALADDEVMKSLADMMGAVLKQTGSAGAVAPIWARVVGELVGGLGDKVAVRLGLAQYLQRLDADLAVGVVEQGQ